MDKFIKVLLVMLKQLLVFMLAGCIALNTACQPQNVSEQSIDAKNFQEFWLWGNIQARPYLNQAKTLYILQGEVRQSKDQSSYIESQGIGSRKLQQDIWLVYRSTHTHWSKQNLQDIINRIETWQNNGNNIVGLQIDFDSGTKRLYDYALFLQKIRKQLPSQYKLGVTGLLDWVNHHSPQTQILLQQNIDEIILQTYQGRHTISNYQQYLKQLENFRIPYKIGLVEHGQWHPQQQFEQSPYFRGYVVFLLPSQN